MEQEHPPYRLMVGDIAACFGKTPGQVSVVLRQLIRDGLLTARGKVAEAGAIPPNRIVVPTSRALRTLEAFRSESDEFVQVELGKLQSD
jgi:hypothetical protein